MFHVLFFTVSLQVSCIFYTHRTSHCGQVLNSHRCLVATVMDSADLTLQFTQQVLRSNRGPNEARATRLSITVPKSIFLGDWGDLVEGAQEQEKSEAKVSPCH